MLKKSVNNKLEYQRLSQEEMWKRGTLGRFVRIRADFFSPTHNGRKYLEELWEKVFELKAELENREVAVIGLK